MTTQATCVYCNHEQDPLRECDECGERICDECRDALLYREYEINACDNDECNLSERASVEREADYRRDVDQSWRQR